MQSERRLPSTAEFRLVRCGVCLQLGRLSEEGDRREKGGGVYRLGVVQFDTFSSNLPLPSICSMYLEICTEHLAESCL